METHLSISKNDIFDAEVVFFRNSYLQSSEKGNFSYILWYSEKPRRIVLVKSKIQSKTTDLQYITTYRSIEEYYEKDLSYHKEHLDYIEEGLFDEIKHFFLKYRKDQLVDEIEKEKKKKENSSDHDENIKKMFENQKLKNGEELEEEIVDEQKEKIEIENDINKYKKEDLPVLLKEKIIMLKKNRSLLKFPKENLVELQKRIDMQNSFDEMDLLNFAKNMIKTFWMLNDPDDKEIELMISKLLNL